MATPDLTAEGSGYYRTYVDGVEQSQHVTERKAIQAVYELREAHPEAEVTYDHDYRVVVGGQVEPSEPEPDPEPEPEPTPEGDPELPRVTVDQLRPTTSRTVSVATRTELDAALADVQPGDEIVVNADLPGPIVLPTVGATGWAVLRGPLGEGRIGAADFIPSIPFDGNSGAIRAEGVRGWWVEGLDARPDTGICREAFVAQSAQDIRFHRVRAWAPGDLSARQIRRGVRLNGVRVAVTGSRIEGVIRSGAQSQGIGIWSGPGPYLIEDNFIESLNQQVLVGGGKPASLADNPSDGTIRRNHLYTRPSWRDITGTIMVLEWKAGERWLAEENVVENDFQGFVMVVKAPSLTQGVEGQRSGDISFRRNRYIGEFTGVGGYMLHRGASSEHTVDASRFLLEDELYEVERDGRSIRLASAPDGVVLRRVTCPASHSSLELLNEAPAGESPRLVIESYRSMDGLYGIWLTDSEFAEGFQSAYPEHAISDYWMRHADPGTARCFRHPKIPDTVLADQQAGLHCVQTEAEIPAEVGADAAVVRAATEGVRDPDRPA